MHSLHFDFRQVLPLLRSHGRLNVWMVYYLRQNDNGDAWPSLKGLTRDTKYSKPYVNLARQWLVEHGALIPFDDDRWSIYPAKQRAKIGDCHPMHIAPRWYRCSDPECECREVIPEEGVNILYTPSGGVSTMLTGGGKHSLQPQPKNPEGGGKHSLPEDIPNLPSEDVPNLSPENAGDEAKENPPTAERLPPYEAPHLYTAAEIQSVKLKRFQWEQLLDRERLGLGRYGVRSTVVTHVEGKLSTPVMEPLLEDMLNAVDAATVQGIDDPGMRGQFIRYIRSTLWAGENPYTPAEVQRFAAECGSVENLYHLAGALSKWRNRKNAKRGDEADNGTRYTKPRTGRRQKPADYDAQVAKYTAR